MVGRTPEYLGKKIEAREIKFAMLAVLILPAVDPGLRRRRRGAAAGAEGVSANSGPHGLSEILYAYSSATGNNGSAFAGLSANMPYWNATLGIAMLLGRFGYVVPVLAMAGSIAAKPKLEPTAGTLPTHGPLFIGLLIGRDPDHGRPAVLPAPRRWARSSSTSRCSTPSPAALILFGARTP